MNKLSVTQWAQNMITRQALVLDTETTGLEPGKIVDIAIIDLKSGKTVFTSFINPGMPIPLEATRIHGITDTMVDLAPSFAILRPLLDQVLSRHPCVIFNVDFDRTFLAAEGLPVNEYTFFCAMEQARRIYGWRRYNLQYACQQEGIDTGTAHRAKDDALATRNLILKWAGKKPGELFPVW